jgi:hypothetical protein
MRSVLPILLPLFVTGCGDFNLKRALEERERNYWESVIKTTTSRDKLFEASYHLPYSFPEEFIRVGEAESYQYLIEKLQSSDPKVRDNAASCLRWFPYGDRNAQLVKAYQRETVLDVRLGLLFAMCNDKGSPEVVELLTSILKGSDIEVRWSAARSLSVIGFPDTDELLGGFTSDPDGRVREEVADHFRKKNEQLVLPVKDAGQLVQLAKNLVTSEANNRSVDISLLPSDIGGYQFKEAKVYRGYLLVRLFDPKTDPETGIIVGPSNQGRPPEIPGYFITPTKTAGLFSYELY